MMKGKANCAISPPPTLRKKREGWGTPCVVVPAEGWASPQLFIQNTSTLQK